MSQVTLQITGMHCGHCVGAVSRALTGIAGVDSADVKVGSATVQFDPARATTEQLAAAVRDEGYEVVGAQ
jgi:copper chaperone